MLVSQIGHNKDNKADVEFKQLNKFFVIGLCCGRMLFMLQQKKYIFYVEGMHCRACEMIIEEELRAVPYVTSAKPDLSKGTVEVAGHFGDMSDVEAMEILERYVLKHGYSFSIEKNKKNKNLRDFKFAIPLAVLFLALFVFLQKIGLVNFVDTDNISYSTVFLIGIVASLSSCMAVVGGLLLSMSATFAKEPNPLALSSESKAKPHILFHAGRLVSFFVLGGVIGIVGTVFSLNIWVSVILGILIALIMLVLGINLLGIFHWSKKLLPSMPKIVSKNALLISKFNHTATPFLVGAVTFFLPCGFTQSMQLYTLTSGGFWEGAFTMFVFAIGTLPALALISFSSASIKDSAKSGIFFKTAGLIVVAFAIFNLINSLVVAGLIDPVFNF